MGYRISYQKRKNRGICRNNIFRLPVLTLMSFSMFILMIAVLWPDGLLFVREVLFSNEKFIPVSALNDFSDELRNGVAFVTALSDFLGRMMP